jgi:hypothetical protein
MNIGDIISGYGDEYGITLHTISGIHGDQTAISIKLYEPDDENFAWAIEQLAILEENE